MTARRAPIVGASGGLGPGLVARLLERGRDVTATVPAPRPRSPNSTRVGPARIEAGVDIDDDAAADALRATLSDAPPFDRAFVVAAAVHTTPISRPGRAWSG